jgi:formiminoglutamase
MNIPNSLFSFNPWDSAKIRASYTPRIGEVRMGDYLLQQSSSDARFVIIGARECCGPLANNGRTGAQFAFPSFVKAFLNTQVHANYPKNSLCILGEVVEIEKVEEVNLHDKVCELDQFLEDLLNLHVSRNQIPIIIGGGHNNALAMMRWAAKHKRLAVINLDAHADLRSTETRHSGNSFSTALSEGTLLHYSVLGLHEAYNNSFILDALKSDQIFHSFYESYLFQKRDLSEDLVNILRHFHTDTHVGLEIDMDSIAYMPSSALSPSGWTLDQVRNFTHQFVKTQKQVAYLNLTEAAPITETDSLLVGKALSYLVRDFTGVDSL